MAAGPGDAWLARFGDEPPTVARLLAERAARPRRARDSAGPEELAAALGVLRAQEGHAVAGLLEDMVALRGVCPDPAGVDRLARVAVSAFVDELVALLQRQVTRDPLTGLANRAAFDEALRHEIAAVRRSEAPTLVLVDLDKFKDVNDTDGHLAGDAVLRAVAELLVATVRTSDIPVRLGGDEFAVILPRTDRRRARPVVNRLLTASRTAPGLASAHVRVTLSIGSAWLAHPQSPEQLVALADSALYHAKGSGGDAAAEARAQGAAA